MLTLNDFIAKFTLYTDEELNDMLQNIEDYSPDAQNALHQVIEAKGGLARLNASIQQKDQIAAEIIRIQKETKVMCLEGIDQEFISKTTSSTLLSTEQVQSIISDQ